MTHAQTVIKEILADKVNVLNIVWGWIVMLFKVFGLFSVAIEAMTPIIAFFSICFLCGYNALKFYKEWRDKGREE